MQIMKNSGRPRNGASLSYLGIMIDVMISTPTVRTIQHAIAVSPTSLTLSGPTTVRLPTHQAKLGFLGRIWLFYLLPLLHGNKSNADLSNCKSIEKTVKVSETRGEPVSPCPRGDISAQLGLLIFLSPNNHAILVFSRFK